MNPVPPQIRDIIRYFYHQTGGLFNHGPFASEQSAFSMPATKYVRQNFKRDFFSYWKGFVTDPSFFPLYLLSVAEGFFIGYGYEILGKYPFKTESVFMEGCSVIFRTTPTRRAFGYGFAMAGALTAFYATLAAGQTFLELREKYPAMASR